MGAVTLHEYPALAFDAAIIRSGEPARYYSSFSAAPQTTPQDKAKALRKAFADCQPGDVVLVGPGTFDFGHEKVPGSVDGQNGNVVLPDQVTIRGLGYQATKLVGSVWSDAQGTQFVLQNSAVEDVTLKIDTYKAHEDGRCVGFDNFLKGPFQARLRRCRIVSNAWGFYCWNNFGHKVFFEDCEFVSGRQCAGAYSGSGGDDLSLSLYRCRFFVDANLSNDIGDTSNPKYGGLFGVVARGGKVRVIDCEAYISDRPKAIQDQQHSWTPRIAAVTDTFGPTASSPHGQLEVYNLRSYISSVAATRVFDVDLLVPPVKRTARIFGGWGMGPSGGLLQS